MRTEAILFLDVEQVGLGPIEIPEPGAGELLLETLLSCVSPGTEMRCLLGTQPGMPTYPVIPGYAAIARVLKTGPGVELATGSLVVTRGTRHSDVTRCWGGHVRHSIADASLIVPVPNDLLPHQVVVTNLAGIAYRGVRLASVQPHESVVVLGLGAIGQCSARLFRATGARVLAVDLSPARVAAAVSAGVDARVPEGDLSQFVREVVPGGADVVVDCTGSVKVLAQAVQCTRDLPWTQSEIAGPRLIIQGSYPAEVPLPYQDAFGHELTIHMPRDVKRGDFETVVGLIQRGCLNLEGLAQEAQPELAHEAYKALMGQSTPITFAFRWAD